MRLTATLELVRDVFVVLRWRLIALLTLMLLSGVFEGLGLTMLFPILAKFGVGRESDSSIQKIIDHAFTVFGLPNELFILLLVTISLLYLQVTFQATKSWMQADCQTRYTANWQRRIFDAFMCADWRFFTQKAAAIRVNAITNEAVRVNWAFYAFAEMAAAAVFIGIYAVISLLASWQVVVFLAIFGAFIFLAIRPLSRRSSAIGEEARHVNEVLQQRSSEFLGAAKLVKATATEARVGALFNNATDKFRLNYRAAAFQPRLITAIYMAAGYTLLGLGLWGAVSWLKLDPAGILVALYVFLRLYVQVTNLQQFHQSFLVSLPAFTGLRKELAEAHAYAEQLNTGVSLPAGPATITIKEAIVRYPAGPALNGVSLEIPGGQVVGVTGPSGAGKSTLVDLMVGLVKSDSGEVRIDGVQIADLHLREWRQSIGYVGQETLLLDGTVALNIGWGTTSDRQEIEKAARAAHIHDFITGLPQGYETEVGDRGIRLSGGQRQRIGLARALMGQKRLLILDEATSALDSASENEVMKALGPLKGRITIVMVAHRLSTLRGSDRLVVLERGKIVETGSWDNLLSREDGAFSNLWHVQRNGTLSDTSAIS